MKEVNTFGDDNTLSSLFYELLLFFINNGNEVDK